MSTVYYILLVSSIVFYIYTAINVILTVKFIDSLSTIMKSKYYSLARSSKIIVIASLILILISYIVPQYLFKLLIVIISMFLNSFNISEIYSLKKYI